WIGAVRAPFWSTAYSVQDLPQLIASIPPASTQQLAIAKDDTNWAVLSWALQSTFMYSSARLVFFSALEVPTPLGRQGTTPEKVMAPTLIKRHVARSIRYGT
ncbi:hypothetical protein Vafri_6023, partial [Volvox africanus]